MRALRVLLIIAVVLGGLFVVADRVAVGFAENEAAKRIRTSEGLDSTPDVSINGFPFLTQLASGKLDDVEIGMKDFDASTTGSGNGNGSGTDSIRIAKLSAHMRGVTFSGDYSSATADTASGTALISYDELLKAAQVEPVQVIPGLTAKVTRLSDGGNGRIKVGIELTGSLLGEKVSQSVSVLGSVKVDGDTVKVGAITLPNLPFSVAEDSLREITDFAQKIDGLPSGIKLDTVRAAEDGVEISVSGSDVKLTG
ncbi:LmeA family phospholipid-binding protein [Streptomyces sp. NPDC002577]